MPQIIIKGAAPYDGTYPIDINLSQLTNRELYTIKELSGRLPDEIGEGIVKMDMGVYVAFGVIALKRSGRFPHVEPDILWEAQTGSVSLDLSDVELVGENENPQNGSLERNGSEPTPSSGTSGNAASDTHPENDQSFTGAPV